MVSVLALRWLVWSAASAGSFSGVRLAAGEAPGSVVASFFFRSPASGEAFAAAAAARLGVGFGCGRSSSGVSSVVAVPVLVAGGVVVPPAPVWVQFFRGGAPGAVGAAAVRALLPVAA